MDKWATSVLQMHFIFIPRLQSGTEEQRSGWATRKEKKISTLASCHSRKKKKKKKKKVEKAGGHFAECACFCCYNRLQWEKIALEKQIVRDIFCVLWIWWLGYATNQKSERWVEPDVEEKTRGEEKEGGEEGAAGLVSLLWFFKCVI